jgi:hypothetical protein
MLHLRNINPMVRAVGTMGAVSALVGGITFAQLTSNTVALSPNTLSTGTANLEIGALGRNNNSGNTETFSTVSPTTNNTSNTTTGNTSTDNNTNNTSSSNNTSAPTTNQSNVSSNDLLRVPTGDCTNTTNGSIPGFNLTGTRGLLPGVPSRALNFCLSNTSRVPLDLTVAIPDDPFTNTTGLQASDVTLNIRCDNGGRASDTLDNFLSTATPKTLGSLDANSSTDCAATVELSNSATISGTETLPSFDIEFTGTTSS